MIGYILLGILIAPLFLTKTKVISIEKKEEKSLSDKEVENLRITNYKLPKQYYFKKFY